jgi:hypothetical protein
VNVFATAGFEYVRPPSVDLTHATPSFCTLLWPGANSNWRHATNTVPFRITAMSQNWLPWTPSETFWMSNVRPPSVERATCTLLLPALWNRVQHM